MREIKLRGYAVEEMVKSQWIYGTGVHTTKFTKEFAEEVGKPGETFIFTESGWIEVHPKSVGEYTGLKDKNGMEIYEGDIVRENYDGESEDGVVIFRDGSFNVCFKPEEELLIGCDSEETEIIGNIYENPELLEELQNGTK